MHVTLMIHYINNNNSEKNHIFEWIEKKKSKYYINMNLYFTCLLHSGSPFVYFGI